MQTDAQTRHTDTHTLLNCFHRDPFYHYVAFIYVVQLSQIPRVSSFVPSIQRDFILLTFPDISHLHIQTVMIRLCR